MFVLIVLAAKAFVAGATELSRDEGYYAMWSLYPSWAYFDHAPGVAWVIGVFRTLMGEGELAVRFGALVSTAGIAAALWRTGDILFGARAAALSVYWYLLSLAAVLLLLIMTPDPLSTLFWTLGVWALAELVRTQNPYWWLAVGVAAGAGLLSKYTNLFFGAGVLLWLIAGRHRWRWFRSWQLWAGGLLSVLMFLPVLIYNYQHGWESLAFQINRRMSVAVLSSGFPGGVIEFVLGHGLLYAPGVMILVLAAILVGLRGGQPGKEGLHLIVLTSAPLLVYFFYYSFRARVEGNWTMPVWPVLTLAAAYVAVSFRPRAVVLKTLRAIIVWPIVPIGVAVTVLVYVQAVFQPFSLEAIDRTRDMHGWRDAARQIAVLAQQNEAEWIALNRDYSVTGLMAYYNHLLDTGLPVRDLAEPFRYRYVPTLPETTRSAPAILVKDMRTRQNMPAANGPFAQVEPLDILVRQNGGDVFGRLATYLARDIRPGVLPDEE